MSMSFPTTSFRTAAVALAAVLLAACTDPTASGRPVAPDAPSQTREQASRPVPASIEWNAVARDLVARNRSSVFVAFRVYALTSVVQRDALDAAEGARTARGARPASGRAAIASASAAVLSSLYPGEATFLEGLVRQQVASPEWIEGRTDAAAGEALGRAAAAAVVEHARTDGYADAWTGSLPTPGEGVWFSSTAPPTAPLGASLTDARPWLLKSVAQFRPAPPPAFGSPAFLADLVEVRQVSDTRTREQDSIAKFWAFGAGTYTPPGYWNAEASRLAVERRLDERRAVKMLALLNMVGMDAIIASNDAKYEYWLLRPSQADPAITTSVPLPNFPAYPSNHATISAAMSEIIAATFPRERRRLRAAADQAALSRVYGGIHFRFDGDAGLALGRKIARYALKVNKHGEDMR